MTRKRNMGRRRSLGSGGGGVLNRDILLRYMETCTIESPTAVQLADFLRSSQPNKYLRYNRQLLTKEVQRTLKLSEDDYEGEDIDNDESPPRKKMKEVKTRHLNKMISSEDSTATIACHSSEESDDYEEEFSTSDDTVYNEKLELEFDLMKDMIREKYIKQAVGDKANRDVLELEVVNNNNDSEARKKVVLSGNQRRRKRKLDSRKREGGGGGSGSGGDVDGRWKFKDIGGINDLTEKLILKVIVPLIHPEVPLEVGGNPTTGILLHGPPGCGKTTLARAIANEAGVPFYKISATELVSGTAGASEENIRELFSKAYRTRPSIVFIDEIDAIASKRENSQRGMEIRLVTQLMTCMDDCCGLVHPTDEGRNSENSDDRLGFVLVIAATNRPDAIDPALRRHGRFGREIFLGVPDEKARVEIFSKLANKRKVEGNLDLEKLARSTPGFVGADLTAVMDEACSLAWTRSFYQRKADFAGQAVDEEHAEKWFRQPLSVEEMEKLRIIMSDAEEAVKEVQPSTKREGFSTVPDVKWEDVGGLLEVKQVFDRYIVGPIKNPRYAQLGLGTNAGVLLYGPPGCGKSLIAKAVANEAGANYIHVKGPELLSKYVGESELSVRKLFSRARTCSPCIIFFDEVDALTSNRGREEAGVVDRVLKQLLMELDGADERRGVFVIGATNRPELMDPALLRPGRFEQHVNVSLPSPHERGLILKALARDKPIDPSVNLMEIAMDAACEHLSGADLAALMREATMAALEDTSIDEVTIKYIHFKQALEKIKPSVSSKQVHHYKLFSEKQFW